MRFEAKHREVISYAKNSNNRINLPLSLPIKDSLMQSYIYMHNRDAMINKINYGPKQCLPDCNLQNYKQFSESLPSNLKLSNIKINVLNWFE